MKILAIDASTKSFGIALFDDNQLIKYECFTASSNDLINRIKKIILQLDKFLSENKVDKIILEEVRPEDKKQNLKTHRALMWLQAAINFLLHENYQTIEVEYVYPNEWRKACGIKTGPGIMRDSLKTADIKFVKENYNITVNDDIADAIGIGHAYVYQLEDKIEWE